MSEERGTAPYVLRESEGRIERKAGNGTTTPDTRQAKPFMTQNVTGRATRT